MEMTFPTGEAAFWNVVLTMPCERRCRCGGIGWDGCVMSPAARTLRTKHPRPHQEGEHSMRATRLIIILLLAGSALSACSLGQSGGTLGALQQIAKTCPANTQVAGYGAIDVSETGRGNPQLTAERLAEVRQLATETAVCGGHLQVVAFSSSEAAYQTLFDDTLMPVGATLNARLLQVTPMVNIAMKTITAALPIATAKLPSQGSDILSQFTAASQYAQQLGHGYQLRVDILTDGLSNTGVAITNVASFDMAAATSLGHSVPVPALPGALVTMIGIGRVATGAPAPTVYIQALTTFYREICSRTGAHCTVVTDPAEEN
jgi:hypothetical protein